MACVTYSLGDRVAVKQPALVDRRYCNRIRTDAHTGETMQCNSPLYSKRNSWVCRVCQAVETSTRRDTRPVRPDRKADDNHWCFDELSDAKDHGSHGLWNAGLGSDAERARLESERRPRAIIEDVEPYWQCSNRETLDEMGITAEVMEMADAVSVRGIEQLDQRLVDQMNGGLLKRVNRTTTTHAFTVNDSRRFRNEDAEWRDAIARLHEGSDRWITPVANALALHSKTRLSPRNVSGTTAWRVVEVTQGWGHATIATMNLNVSSVSPLWYVPVLPSADPGQTNDSILAQQQALVDDDDA